MCACMHVCDLHTFMDLPGYLSIWAQYLMVVNLTVVNISSACLTSYFRFPGGSFRGVWGKVLSCVRPMFGLCSGLFSINFHYNST